jgi:hypothetical protein
MSLIKHHIGWLALAYGFFAGTALPAARCVMVSLAGKNFPVQLARSGSRVVVSLA